MYVGIWEVVLPNLDKEWDFKALLWPVNLDLSGRVTRAFLLNLKLH